MLELLELLTADEKSAVLCILEHALLRYDEHSYESHTIEQAIVMLERK